MTITTTGGRGWRLVDIVVAAVVAVAFGVVFLAWNTIYAGISPAFGATGVVGLLNGVWLLPGVLVGLIVRRPGAAFFGNFVAAAVSAFIGSQWGLDALLSGVIQGVGAELGFALFLYRSWGPGAALLAGALAGLGAAIHDIVVYYPTAGPGFIALYAITTVASGVIIAGLGAWLLLRALVRTGVLADFAVGRSQDRI